jgi:basic membrane lipoprotein Med (substrate-binding protein (PBP1-ABC) superfamily)
VHMKDERDSRRREIAAALIDAGVEVVIDDAGTRRSGRCGRNACGRW